MFRHVPHGADYILLPRVSKLIYNNIMHAERDIVGAHPFVRPSVRPTHFDIISKRIHIISSNSFHDVEA